MNHLSLYENFNQEKDIIITIPKSISWDNYKKELISAENGEIMNFKVNFFPKFTKTGKKCYVLHNGKIKGWMKICGLISGGFDCTTTGKRWEGNFIQRTGKFNYLDEEIPMKGFRGYRYFQTNP